MSRTACNGRRAPTGHVYDWGNNHYGQLGELPSPGTVGVATQASVGLTDIVAVAAGGRSA